ncbi:MAG TPA: IPT/TIG domain-containing protein [Kofleriaceae bacterium]|jgi:hypothetical protein
MRKTLLGAALVAALAPYASAQPHPIDHPGHGPVDHGPRAPRFGDITPGSAKPGETVTIHGDHLPPDAKAKVNGRSVVTSVAPDGRSITFSVPPGPPSRVNVTVTIATTETPVGSIEILPEHGPPPIVPPRDHGEPPPPPGMSPPPPGMSPPPPPPGGPGGHHDWHMDRPVVSSFFPPKGQPGTTIHVRGQNFAPDSQVLWAGAPVPGVRVTPEEITFNVPAGAATGALSLRSGGLRRELPIGNFEVAVYNYAAEQKRWDDDARARAEASWHARKIEKDKAARDAALAQQEAQLEASRASRRTEWLAQERKKFQAAFLADPETQSELALHAKRGAEIDRMERLAEDLDNEKLAVRIQVLGTRENARHDERMKELEAAFRAGGGK